MSVILVVEQDASYAERIIETLKSEGWQAEAFKNRDAAVEAAAAQRPKLVIASATLPDAPQLLATFSRRQGGPGSVVLVPVALASQVSANDYQADELLAKPFSDDDLVEIVHHVTEEFSFRPEDIQKIAVPRRPAYRETEQLTSADIFGDVLAEVEAEAQKAEERPKHQAITKDSEDIQRKLEETLSGVMPFGNKPRRKTEGEQAKAAPTRSQVSPWTTEPEDSERPRRKSSLPSESEIDDLLDRTLSSLELPQRSRTKPKGSQVAPPEVIPPDSGPIKLTEGATGVPSTELEQKTEQEQSIPSAAARETQESTASSQELAEAKENTTWGADFETPAFEPPSFDNLDLAESTIAATEVTPPEDSSPLPKKEDTDEKIASQPTEASENAALANSWSGLEPTPDLFPSSFGAEASAAPEPKPESANPETESKDPQEASFASVFGDGTPLHEDRTESREDSSLDDSSLEPVLELDSQSAELDPSIFSESFTPAKSLSFLEGQDEENHGPEAALEGVLQLRGNRFTDQPMEAPEKGEAFGDYTLLDRIAVGGMAEVWRAHRRGVEGFQKIVAIKKILSHLTDSTDFVTMFIDEAKLAAQLNHNNVTQIYDLGKVGDDFFIAMEHVDGKDLRTILSAGQKSGQALPSPLALMIVAALARALDYAHRKRGFDGSALGLVHRDVSPQNVLISYEGEIKLCDFGIVKAVTKASTTQMGALKGKLQYMSPEQAWGKNVDARSDIFSLGSVLFEVLTGTKLFSGDNEIGVLDAVRECRTRAPSELIPALPQEVDRIVAKALAQNPDERYQTAGELEQDLNTVLDTLKPSQSQSDLATYMVTLFHPQATSTRASSATVPPTERHEPKNDDSRSWTEDFPPAPPADSDLVSADNQGQSPSSESAPTGQSSSTTSPAGTSASSFLDDPATESKENPGAESSVDGEPGIVEASNPEASNTETSNTETSNTETSTKEPARKSRRLLIAAILLGVLLGLGALAVQYFKNNRTASTTPTVPEAPASTRSDILPAPTPTNSTMPTTAVPTTADVTGDRQPGNTPAVTSGNDSEAEEQGSLDIEKLVDEGLADEEARLQQRLSREFEAERQRLTNELAKAQSDSADTNPAETETPTASTNNDAPSAATPATEPPENLETDELNNDSSPPNNF